MLESVMTLLRSVLMPLFIAGMIGSTVVVAITFVNDVIDFASGDDAAASQEPRR